MISINDITISYTKDKKIINSLSLILNKNMIHGIVGLNGAGKTTLLNGLYGLKKHGSGSIKYNNDNISKYDISYLVTENYFYSGITAREYLSLFKNAQFDDEKWNKLFILPLDQIIDSFSTGMKKKLAILGILKQNKPIMILDEPFNGLDFETCRILRSIILKLKETGKTIIITSHVIETLTNLCDYIHYLEDGRIKYSKEKYEFSDFEKDIFEFIEIKNNKLINDVII